MAGDADKACADVAPPRVYACTELGEWSTGEDERLAGEDGLGHGRMVQSSIFYLRSKVKVIGG